MILFLYGKDTYRSRQKLNEIVEQYKKTHKSGLNLKYLDGQKLDFQDFKNQIQSLSMFEEKKLVVIEDSFSNPDFKERFLKDSKKFLDSKNIVLFYEQNQINKVGEKDPLFKFLKNNAQSQEFEPLQGQQLKNWAKKEFANYKCKIEEKILEKLIEFIGNDLWRFSNEIKKLASFKSEINDKDIKLLVKPRIETDIFKTIDFLASKNRREALGLIKKHIEKGDSPLYLLSMINFQFRNLLVIKSCGLYIDSAQLTKKLGMHPYVIRKTIQQAKRFTFEELKKIYQKIFEVDLNIKTGKIQPEIALDLLITEI